MRSEELNKLLAQMSIKEKIGELFQIPSYFFSESSATGPALEMGITDEDVRLTGSCLSVIGARTVQKIQETHTTHHPHHIPMLFMADIINGYRTIFPIPLAQGCTFSPAMAERCAAISAREAAASGIHVTFSPMADLVRDPRWGRVMESTGEDPYLNGLMAAAMIRGYQGADNDLTQKGKIAACLKHFAGYGAPLGGRDYNTVELSPRTLRDEYLPAYKAAIDAGCALVMTSFNTLDKIPSTGNRWLMQDVLRDEMGFSGVLISDWAAVSELMVHGIAQNAPQAALLAMNAGVDIDMASPVYIKNVKTLVEQGDISMAQLDEAVMRVLMLKNQLGLFENPYKDASEEDERSLLLCPAHRAVARECAERSFVLLKNEGALLPLPQNTGSTAFIGPYVDNQLISGAWSFFGDDKDCVTLRAGVETLYPQAQTFFAPGCPIVDPSVEVLGFQKQPPKDDTDPVQALQQAVALARQADRVVLALGEHRDYTGEGASKADLTLPRCQLELLRQVCAVNPHVCVVLFGGRPLDIRPIAEQAQAIVEAWLPGTEGGNALARLLFGDAAPSGKLAMSMPYCVGQIPVFYSHMNTGRPFFGDYRKERYASQYRDIPNEPLYPFGFGLTYSEFTVSPVRLDNSRLAAGGSINACVTVTNIGQRDGMETIQLYIQDHCGSVARPVRELKAFQQITLAPGESGDVSFAITEEMLRFYNIDMRYTSEPGDFSLYIGLDSTTQNKASFTLV